MMNIVVLKYITQQNIYKSPINHHRHVPTCMLSFIRYPTPWSQSRVVGYALYHHRFIHDQVLNIICPYPDMTVSGYRSAQ